MLELDVLDIVVLVLALAIGGYFILGKKKEEAKAPRPVARAPSTSSAGGSAAGATSPGDSEDFVAKMKAENIDVIVFYGSQTGTAEDYAGRLVAESRRYGLRAMLCDLQDVNLANLQFMDSKKHAAIFVMATYGEGDPTDNAAEFHKLLKEKIDEKGSNDWPLNSCNYAVFGLGNKTYEKFNEVAIFVDKALAGFNAHRIVKVGLGDDDANLEEDFVTWKEDLWPELCTLFGKDISLAAASHREYKMTLHADGELDTEQVYTGEHAILRSLAVQKKPFNQKNPYLGKITALQQLYRNTDRSCIHIEVDLANSGLRYTAGDHVAVYPTNNTQLVEGLAKRLDINLDAVFSLKAVDNFAKKQSPWPCPTSFRTALHHYVDITSHPKTHILQALAQYASDEKEKERLLHLGSKHGKTDYAQWIVKEDRDILHVLEDLKSVKPPVDVLLEMLPRLQPRFYSISSSSKMFPTSVHITASVVRYKTALNKEKHGVATTWLEKKAVGDTIPVFIRTSQFRLPTKSSVPVIMVGPGTGLAPFRGFIQERHVKYTEAAKAGGDAGATVGTTWLFFGCQNRHSHFMYEDELNKYVEAGSLKLTTAFSRDGPTKEYVQHKIAGNKEVWDLIKAGAHVYICGDGKHMSKDVQKALQNLVVTFDGKTEAEAIKFWKDAIARRRLQLDVWS